MTNELIIIACDIEGDGHDIGFNILYQLLMIKHMSIKTFRKTNFKSTISTQVDKIMKYKSIPTMSLGQFTWPTYYKQLVLIGYKYKLSFSISLYWFK